jgi:hypothetical protein
MRTKGKGHAYYDFVFNLLKLAESLQVFFFFFFKKVNKYSLLDGYYFTFWWRELMDNSEGSSGRAWTNIF